MAGHKAAKTTRKRFENQRTRGTQGFGFVELIDGVAQEPKRAQEEKEMREQLEASEADEIFFHHRFPTSTPNVLGATHPIFVSHKDLKYDYYVVHNGVLSNDDVLKTKYEALGFVYTTKVYTKYEDVFFSYTVKEQFNDSESLAIDVAIAIEQELDKLESKGSIAFIALQIDKETKKAVSMYYGRNYRNPLKAEVSKDQIVISSEGNGTEVPPHKLFRLDYATNIMEEVRGLSIGDNIPIHTPTVPAVKEPMGYKCGRREYDDRDGYSDHYDLDEEKFNAWYQQQQEDQQRRLQLAQTGEEAGETAEETSDNELYEVYLDENYPRVYLDIVQMQDDYAELIEQCAEFEDDVKDAIKDGDMKAAEESQAYLEIIKGDLAAYERAFKQYKVPAH